MKKIHFPIKNKKAMTRISVNKISVLSLFFKKKKGNNNSRQKLKLFKKKLKISRKLSQPKLMNRTKNKLFNEKRHH